MSEDTLHRIWTVFEDALEYEDTGARRRFVDETCGNDVHVAEEVHSLIEAHKRESVLDRPLHMPSSSSDDGRAASTENGTATGEGGRQIGPYQIEDEIGRGGMGVVYRARDERLERSVALKMLPHHLSADDDAKARLEAEARAAARLEHPNIATVYDIGEAPDGRMYIAMAYYEGETLDQRIARRPLTLEEARDVFSQIANGLDRAHDAGIVHRDIKPANILVTRRGAVKILDFGIAKVAELKLTRSGEAIGTVAYMSPEQARGTKIDHRSDIWSLGVVLFEALTGRRPFTGTYNDAVLYAIVHEAAPAPSAVRAGLPPSVDRVIETALRKEPHERYDCAGELVAALRTAEKEDADLDPPAVPAVPSSPERVRATVVVSQLSGYLQLVDRLVPDELSALGHALRDRARDVVEAHGGVVHEITDEAITAIFGVPNVHEDDFVRAVRAARELHDAVRALADDRCRSVDCDVRLSTGIDTDSVVIRPSSAGTSMNITGTAINIARRISHRAKSDEILVSPDTERLIRPFFETQSAQEATIQSPDGPLTPFRLKEETGSTTRLEAAQRLGLTKYAGRDRDLETLSEVLQQTREGSGQLIAVVGEAGMGKSRLLFEFEQRVPDGVNVIQGRCVPHGGNIPFLPFSGVLRRQLELSEGPTEDEVVERVLGLDESLEVFLPYYMHLLAIESEAYPVPDLQREDLRIAMVEAISGMFTLSAGDRPLVLLLEDWHWSDPASQAVLKQLGELAPAHPMMVVVTYRPEYEGKPLGHGSVIHLQPLGVEQTNTMVASIVGANEVPEELAGLIHERTGGNPFFLEEVCRTLLEENVLNLENDRDQMVQSVAALDLPDTVQAVIRTRLHRLNARTRKILRVASIAGREFSRRLLRSVLADEDDLSSQLDTLCELDLIQKSAVLPEVTYRFKHALTQEVVYETLLHHQRKAFHQDIGEALEEIYSDRLDEHLDLFIHHFSLAEAWEKAAHYGRLAGARASGLGQLTEAAALLEDAVRWLSRLPEQDRDLDESVQLLLELERACETTGDRGRQQAILDEVEAMLQPDGDDALLAELYVRQGDLHVLRGRFAEAERALELARRRSEAADRPDVYRRTLRSLGFLRWREGRTDEAIEINERLLEMHREDENYDAMAGDLINIPNILVNEHRYEEALRYAEEAESILDRVSNYAMHTGVLHCSGTIHNLLGHTEEALERLERSKAIAEEHLLPLQKCYSLTALANLYWRLGDTERSVSYFEKTVSMYRDAGHMDGLAKALAILGQVQQSMERNAQAVATLEEAADLLRELEDVHAEAPIRRRIARLLEERDSIDEAERAWRRVSELLEHIDASYELDVVEAFGRIARERGDAAEALSHFHDAIELARHLEMHAREAHLCNTVGILEWNRGNYQAALSNYEKALRYFETIEDEAGVGLMLNSMAACLNSLDRFENARETLERALDVHRAAKLPTMEAHALSLLGDVSMQTDDLDAALQAYADSLQLRWELDDRTGEGWMLQRMARVHAARGDDEQAVGCAEQALAIAEELDDERLENACRGLLE